MNTKHDMRSLAKKMSIKSGVHQKDCEKILYNMFEEVVESLKNGEGFTITNFGRFDYNVQFARKIRNRETGEWDGWSPPKTNLTFTPCWDLKYGVRALDWKDYITEEQKTKDWYQMQLDFEEKEKEE